MFFSGDPTTRKRVDLGGRSSKERDRQKLLEQTRLERNRRLYLRRQNHAAIKIQVGFIEFEFEFEFNIHCYIAALHVYVMLFAFAQGAMIVLVGKKAMEIEHSKVREQFFATYGRHIQNVNRQCFGPQSAFFRQLFFFFNARNVSDISVLVETCRLMKHFVQESGDVVGLFAGIDYSSKRALVDFRVKKFAFACIQAVHQNRKELKDQLFVTPEESNTPPTLLLEAVVLLIDSRLPWTCKVVSYLLERNVFTLLRELIVTGKESMEIHSSYGRISSLERVLTLIIPHIGQKPCICPNIDPRWSFFSQILTIPFLWHLFPYIKEVFATGRTSQHYIHQMALCVQNHANVLPHEVSMELPGYACLLGNILETAGVALSQPDCSFEMGVDLAAITTFLLKALPPIKSSRESSMVSDDDMTAGDEVMELVINRDLEKQITSAIDSRFLLQLTNVLFSGIHLLRGPHDEGPGDKEVAAVGAACAFLHVAFNTLPLEHIMTVLAYRTELVQLLWHYMKRCHEIRKWPFLPYLSGDAPGWLLPLAVFCPVYKHMLTIVDNEEFYEQEKPLSLKDIRHLIVILREALWHLLWLNPTSHPNVGKSVSSPPANKMLPAEAIQHRVSTVASEATIDGTRANEILKQAPFLVPFTSRAKIFQLASVRQRHGSHGVFTRSRFRIRRDHILEDAYSQMSTMSEEDLRGAIRVTFVNELGVEEAGIDGGGIFKDFMENITRAAFDVQYGLFKETSDHLLYPNPGSGMIHEQHLQFFHFLGILLAKAMFEGILVDIPFATFFLSKLKRKYELHTIALAYCNEHYEADISELELYFVILNNEYGEQTEEELLPGGKNIRVTNENVITFIHLVSNHRLNFQIRQQSSHFLRGFQQLIQKDWINMFNEHELQLLISGSLDSLDFDDLRQNTNYVGGYHSEHYVIEMFWEVLKSFSLENQKKFLKAAGSASEEALDRLPTSATCMNLLKLPPYRSKEQMSTKLLYAINAEAGFDLS
ncbi:E3 ubiquitin-protein ligase UPL6 [Citrus sinensis]|uniref:E3 ubiquitin-protein ligase UPL6 n=1 Tax=Citrus sinensis TaxID=2711 RepID=A0ACB8IA75_CITSI|nr:E3 ubiquitin-protein ligase UPL6 [Citrus sinensis]